MINNGGYPAALRAPSFVDRKNLCQWSELGIENTKTDDWSKAFLDGYCSTDDSENIEELDSNFSIEIAEQQDDHNDG